MAPAVGNNRQIYAHYHHLKKAYDVLKIPALRHKYNQYGFEGLSNLKYAQAKVTNRYAPNLSEGWDPDGPTASKVPIGIGARVLNDFCAPNIAAMSFDSSGVEYKSLGELGAIVATHPGSGDWIEDTSSHDMGIVLTGTGGSVLATTSSSSGSQKPKKRQKFFTIAPLPIGTHFQAAGPIPLEDLFEMELENSDGSDDELFLNEGSSPIIAGPVGGTLQFAPLSDVQPIRFQDGASVSMNGRSGIGVASGRKQAVPSILMAPLLSDRPPIQFQNGASVSAGRMEMAGGSKFQPSSPPPPKNSPTKSNGEKSIPWPLSKIETPSSSAVGTLATDTNPTKPLPSWTPNNSNSKQQQRGRRQKFFTIAPLALGKAYQRAPKMSVNELFEEYDPLEGDSFRTEARPLSSPVSMETTNDHSTGTLPVPFPNLDLIPNLVNPASSGGTSADLGLSVHQSMVAVVATSPGTLYQQCTVSAHPKSATTTTPRRNNPLPTSKSPTSVETIRLYTIRPLPVGQAYKRAPSVDRATIFEAVGPEGEEHDNEDNYMDDHGYHYDDNNVTCRVVPNPPSVELEKMTSRPMDGAERTMPAFRLGEPHTPNCDEQASTVVDYGSLLQQACTGSVVTAAATTTPTTAAAAAATTPATAPPLSVISPLGSVQRGGMDPERNSASTTRRVSPTRLTSAMLVPCGNSQALGLPDPTHVTVGTMPGLAPGNRRSHGRNAAFVKDSLLHPVFSQQEPPPTPRPTHPMTATTTRKALEGSPSSTSSSGRASTTTTRRGDGDSSGLTSFGTASAAGLKSQQDRDSWWKEAQGRLTVAEPLPSSLFFSKRATDWKNRFSSSSS